MRTEAAAAATESSQRSLRCAAMLLELMPRVMKTIRGVMGDTFSGTLTMPQFRVMYFVEQNAGASLSGVAEFLGLSLPSASKLVDHLVKRELLARTADAVDRRRMTLRVTPAGAAMLEASHSRVRQVLSGVLSALDESSQRQAEEGLKVLQARFGPPPAAGTDAGGTGVPNPPEEQEADPRR